MVSDEGVVFVTYLNRLFDQVEQDAADRHNAGAEKYGSFKFLTADTLEELYEEVLDLINYGRYTAVKVKLLQEALAEAAAETEGSQTTPAGTFIPTAEVLKKGFIKE